MAPTEGTVTASLPYVVPELFGRVYLHSFYSKMVGAEQALDRKVMNRRALDFDVKFFASEFSKRKKLFTSDQGRLWRHRDGVHAGAGTGRGARVMTTIQKNVDDRYRPMLFLTGLLAPAHLPGHGCSNRVSGPEDGPEITRGFLSGDEG